MADPVPQSDGLISRSGDGNGLRIETEREVAFAGGRVEIVNYSWSEPMTDVWTSDSYFLHICLSERPGPAQVAYLDTGRQIRERAGRTMFIPSRRMVRTATCSGNLRSLVCAITPSLVEDLLPGPPTWEDRALAEGLRLNSPQVDFILLQMYRELRHPGFASDVLVGSLATGLAVALIRKFKLDREAPERRTLGGLAPWRMNRLRDRVQAEAPAPALGDLAELCGMSVRHLSRAFKAETGITVAQFVESATIDRACRLLADPHRSLGEVAQALGFAGQGSFSFAFRRATGTSPSDYRAQARARAH